MSAARRAVIALAMGSMLLVTGGASAEKKKPGLGDILRLGRGVAEAAGGEIPVSGLEIQRRTYGVVAPSALDRELNGLLSELKGFAPPERQLDAIVYVTPDPAFRAVTAPDASIFLAYGLLQSIESKDELAALLAHEYAHVVLGHNKVSGTAKLLKTVGGVGNLYLGQRYGSLEFDDLARSDIRHILSYGAALESVQSGLVPNWSRKHETAADKLGLDLLVAAGYSPVAMLDFLSRMSSWEEAQKAIHDRQQLVMVDLAAPAAAAASQGNISGAAEHVIAGGIRNLFSTGANALSAGLRKARRQHDTADRRSEEAISHLEAHHPDAERPELQPLPWATDKNVLALLDGIDKTHALVGHVIDDDAQGAARLATDIRRSPAGGTPYVRYALLQYDSRRRNGGVVVAEMLEEVARTDALYLTHFLVLDLVQDLGPVESQVHALEQSQKALGDPPELLPRAVRIYARAGDNVKAQMAVGRCLGHSDDALQAACGKALE